MLFLLCAQNGFAGVHLKTLTLNGLFLLYKTTPFQNQYIFQTLAFKTQNICEETHHQTGIAIANRVLMRTTTSIIKAASGSFKRATSPTEAVLTVLEETTTSVSLWARVVFVTLGWWLDGRWRGWSRVWWVLTFLSYCCCSDLHGDSTLSCGLCNVMCHLYVSSLSPASSP